MVESPTPTHARIRLDAQGRLLIPAALRKSLGFEAGETLVARQEDGRLILEKPENIRQRLKNRFAHIQKGTSLADELIAERRRNTPPHILD